MPRPQNCKKCKQPKVKGKCINCGQPTAITQEVEKDLKELLRLGFPIRKAVKIVGISERTFYYECKRNDKFLQQMTKAKKFASVIARKSVINAMPGNPELALRWLTLKEKDEFSPKINQTLDGTIAIDYGEEAKKRLRKYAPPGTAENAAVRGVVARPPSYSGGGAEPLDF